jgi:hypothetical protein
MKKNINISPVGLKGDAINERMKQLMGVKSVIKENTSNIVVELTKMGPDGKSYAIIRENHEWYIKVTSKTSSILAEDFQYIGGLMNKKSEAYPSYAKAIKQLNLKFKSLAEAYNVSSDINIFENDNLISEEDDEDYEKASREVEYGVKPEDEDEEDEDDELTEAEKAVDEIIAREELKGGQKKLDVNKNGKLDSDDFEKLRDGQKDDVNESKITFSNTLKNIDNLLNNKKKN